MTKSTVIDKANDAFSHQARCICDYVPHFETICSGVVVVSARQAMRQNFRCSGCGRTERQIQPKWVRTFSSVRRFPSGRSASGPIRPTGELALAPVLGRLILWGQADPVALRDPPEPGLIEIDFKGRLRDPISRSIEQRITEFSVVMPGVVSDAVSANRMTGQRARPGLRQVVGQSAVRDFSGCPDASETGPAGSVSDLF